MRNLFGTLTPPHNWLRKALLIAATLLVGSAVNAEIVSIQGNFGKYVVAEGDQKTVNANRDAVGPWEKWEMTRNGNMVTFKSNFGKFMSAQPNGTIEANRGTVGPWEQFQVQDIGGGLVYFRTAHGTYLTAEPAGTFVGNRKAAGNWERFKISSVGGTPVPTPSPAPPPTTSSLSRAQLDTIVAWMTKEKSVYDTPLCYRSTYDRGIGIAPQICGAGKTNNAGLCYDNCRDGYRDNGTATCVRNCPSGYSESGLLLCHYNGTASYSPVHWDNCKSRGLFGECWGGLTEDGCRDGYYKSASMCWKRNPEGLSGSALDPVRDTYSRGGSRGSCGSDRNDEVGLCYLKPREGYSCQVTMCQQNCAAGTMACGPATCAKDKESCGQGVADMVVSPALMVANVFTFGTASKAGGAAKTAAKGAEQAAKSSMKNVKKFKDAADNGANALAAINLMRDAVEKLALVGEEDIAALSNDEIADAIEARYPKGSAAYKAIGRRWANIVAAIWAKELQIELAQFVTSVADPSGVLGTIYAFEKPMCGQHKAFPL